MTNKNKERVLTCLKALTEDAAITEMPESLFEKCRAAVFYDQSKKEKDPERAFLALYNAYGTLLGFRPAPAAMAEDLETEPRLVRSILARVRREEGDTETPEELGPRPQPEQLESLKSGLRRRLLAQL